MSAPAAMPVSTLIKQTSVLPPLIEAVLRRAKVDKFTGNVQLNIRDGEILGYHKLEIVSLSTK